ncbi:MAG: methyltransferase domain-containing protein [Alphaproteobacteria bacterium]
MTDPHQHIVDFYSRHPISGPHILAKLRAERGTLDGLRPADLWPHDQDHYGGLAVNDAIAAAAGIGEGCEVVDFCAGLGGPARYLAETYGARVTGIDLNPDRVAGAAALTAAVGLESRVWVIEGDVTRTGMSDASADVVMSQEAFLHLPEKAAAVAEAFRLLRPGGRFCFTDWVTDGSLSDDESDLLWRGLGAQALQDAVSYRDMLTAAGFEVVSIDGLTAAWATILAERRAMYTKLREETLAAGMPAGDEDFYRAYVLLVDGVTRRRLGGARFTARKPLG